MNVLVLSRWCPAPLNNGSKLRIHSILRALAIEHRVTLVCFYDPAEQTDDYQLRAIGVEDIHLVKWRPFDPSSWRAILGLLSTKPRSIVATWSREFEDVLDEAVRCRNYDVALASQVWTAVYHNSLCGIPAIFEEVDLGIFRDGRGTPSNFVRPFLHRLSWEKHARFTRRLVERYACCTVVSEVEAALLSSVAGDYERVRVIPNGIDLDGCRQFDILRERNLMVFSGSLTYWPNCEAMKWFLAEVYPLIKAKVPNGRLIITGGGVDRSLPLMEDVIRTGLLPDVRPVVASAAVSMAPILSGGGTRLKILEAMALRTPVVATSKAAEGLRVRDGEHLLIADTASEFAESVVRVLTQPQVGQRLAESAFELVRLEYDWKVLGPRVLELVREVADA